MIVALAEVLPGTPVDRLWEMDVSEALDYLIAAAALRRQAAGRAQAAAEPSGARGPAARPSVGRRAGLAALRPFLTGAR